MLSRNCHQSHKSIIINSIGVLSLTLRIQWFNRFLACHFSLSTTLIYCVILGEYKQLVVYVQLKDLNSLTIHLLIIVQCSTLMYRFRSADMLTSELLSKKLRLLFILVVFLL